MVKGDGNVEFDAEDRDKRFYDRKLRRLSKIKADIQEITAPKFIKTKPKSKNFYKLMGGRRLSDTSDASFRSLERRRPIKQRRSTKNPTNFQQVEDLRLKLYNEIADSSKRHYEISALLSSEEEDNQSTDSYESETLRPVSGLSLKASNSEESLQGAALYERPSNRRNFRKLRYERRSERRPEREHQAESNQDLILRLKEANKLIRKYRAELDASQAATSEKSIRTKPKISTFLSKGAQDVKDRLELRAILKKKPSPLKITKPVKVGPQLIDQSPFIRSVKRFLDVSKKNPKL